MKRIPFLGFPSIANSPRWKKAKESRNETETPFIVCILLGREPLLVVFETKKKATNFVEP